MNERIRFLREEGLKSIPGISGERARLLTEFYRDSEIRGLAPPVQR